MVFVKASASKRITINDCKNALSQLLSRYDKDLATCLTGMVPFKIDGLEEKLSQYKDKAKAFIEYFHSQLDELSKQLLEIMKKNNKVRIYIFRLNLWVTYKTKEGPVSKAFIGSVVEPSEKVQPEKELSSEPSMKADIVKKLSFELSLSALYRIIGTSYEQNRVFFEGFQNQTDILTDEDMAELNKLNDAYLTGSAERITELANKLLEFSSHEDISLDIKGLSITGQSYDEDESARETIVLI